MRLSARTFIVLSSLLVSIVLISIFYNMHRLHYGFSDAAYRTMLFIIEDTIWSDEFAEDKFSKLQIGMNEQEVFSLLGSPLRKTCGQTDCEWVYSWQKTGNSSFDRRDIIFDLEGRITRIRHEFYID